MLLITEKSAFSVAFFPIFLVLLDLPEPVYLYSPQNEWDVSDHASWNYLVRLLTDTYMLFLDRPHSDTRTKTSEEID